MIVRAIGAESQRLARDLLTETLQRIIGSLKYRATTGVVTEAYASVIGRRECAHHQVGH